MLGSSANQILHREGVAFLVESAESNLLVDCGPGIVSSIGKAKRNCSDIDNILLTHVHGDHISGFAYFVWNRFYEHMGKSSKANNLDVYGLKDTIELASFMISHSYPTNKFPFEVFYHILDENDSFEIKDMTVTTFPANHVVPTISCFIENDEKKLIYSSDTLPTEKLNNICSNPDMLIFEGMFADASIESSIKSKHSTARDAGKTANKIKAKQLLLVHIAPSLFGNEKQLLLEAREEFLGPIMIPIEGSVIVI